MLYPQVSHVPYFLRGDCYTKPQWLTAGYDNSQSLQIQNNASSSNDLSVIHPQIENCGGKHDQVQSLILLARSQLQIASVTSRIGIQGNYGFKAIFKTDGFLTSITQRFHE